MHTNRPEDIAWLEGLVARDGLQDQYILLRDDKVVNSVWELGGDFSYLWGKYATDDDTIYVKIDDDSEQACPETVFSCN